METGGVQRQAADLDRIACRDDVRFLRWLEVEQIPARNPNVRSLEADVVGETRWTDNDVANQRRADYVARLGDWSVERLTKLAFDLARYNEALETIAQANGAR